MILGNDAGREVYIAKRSRLGANPLTSNTVLRWLCTADPVGEWVRTIAHCENPVERYLGCFSECKWMGITSVMYVDVRTSTASAADIPHHQEETWRQIDRVLNRNNPGGVDVGDGVRVRHWGASFVLLSGCDPADSARIQWGRFDDSDQLSFVDIDESTLIELLRFRRDSDTFEDRVPPRKTTRITVVVPMEPQRIKLIIER